MATLQFGASRSAICIPECPLLWPAQQRAPRPGRTSSSRTRHLLAVPGPPPRCGAGAQQRAKAGRPSVAAPALGRDAVLQGGGAGPGAAAAAFAAPPPAAFQEAWKAGKLAFGFSAGGLLFPYYLGVAERLQELGVMREDSQLAGASAGSLIVACIKSGLPLSDITDACFELAHDCRSNGTRHRLKHVLQGVLQRVLPDDVAQRCTGQVHVAVTAVSPGFKPKLVRRFRDKDDLVAALLTSCHIPWYFDGSLITTFRKRPCFDGGFTNFLPDVPGAQATCRVCCLPSRQLASVGKIAISPDAFVDSWPYSMKQMLAWAFEPAEEEQLRELIECGRRDALEWAQRSGLAELAAAAAAVEGGGEPVRPALVLPSGAAVRDG